MWSSAQWVNTIMNGTAFLYIMPQWLYLCRLKFCNLDTTKSSVVATSLYIYIKSNFRHKNWVTRFYLPTDKISKFVFIRVNPADRKIMFAMMNNIWTTACYHAINGIHAFKTGTYKTETIFCPMNAYQSTKQTTQLQQILNTIQPLVSNK